MEIPATPVILRTPRLALRLLEEEDLPAVLQIFGDPETMRHYPRAYSREEVLGILHRQRTLHQERGMGLWAVVERATGDVVGDCGLLPQLVDGREEIEVAYHLNRTRWGRGYATEAAAAVADHARDQMHIRRLVALIRPSHLASQGVARRIGMRLERTVAWRDRPHLLYASEPPAQDEAA